MKSEFVLLDFDGVIADTFQLCLSIVQNAQPSETPLSFRDRFTLDTSRSETLNQTDQAGVDFFREYSHKILDQPVVPGISDVLEFIGENFTTILVTSTTSPPVKKFLAHHQLTNHFSALFCNDVPSLKSAKFKLILSHYKIEPSECVFVTDTVGDIKEAHSVNIPSVAVTWGYHDEDTLAKGNPVTIIDYPTQLKGAIEEALDFSLEYDEH